ncbi:TIGR02206 family membrane protein [Bacillus sp. RO1]|uniref:YwaF family protein n=1 Tax=Bacillus sp. RO1 TaxID=2722703 RepID=UPI0014564332|nr:TIGR02206 family membrane protein [Bacillus sp. RO1]NLP49408.1 TIGR02206 family membrane protein [Bacillus sp. RO1]
MFSVNSMQSFELFSVEHILTFFVFVGICFMLVHFRRDLKPHQTKIKWTLFIILLTCEITHQIWVLSTNQWGVEDLPIQLCSVSTFIAIYLFLRSNEKLFHLLYFIGFIPPILSMVTPEMVYQFPHYRFLKYFLHHSAIPLAVLYFIFYEGYRVPKKAVIRSFIALNILAAPIFFINMFLGTNFFYLANPTESKTILSFFGSGFWYYINLELAALLIFFLTYIPMARLMRRERRIVG